MKAIEIARKMAALKQVSEAQEAYTLAITENGGADPAVDLEAACYILSSGGNYEIAYTCFLSLYERGCYQEELFDLMVNAFYVPNVKLLEQRYRRNCKYLERYPYLFRKDFLAFENLPVKFFPYNDAGFIPFDTAANRFGGYVNFKDPVISRNFFRDLDDPILAADVYSQYELEYLNDNVRRSEWVARENHIYLHYTDWAMFCSCLQCLDLRDLLKSEKLVFLIEEEISLYPIDFKARFGIDYSQYHVKPISVREVNRLIWHTQLAAHNGGDFFNEILYGHPNLLVKDSMMFSEVQKVVAEMKQMLKRAEKSEVKLVINGNTDDRIIKHLARLKDRTDKDLFVALFLADQGNNQCLDRNARIAPAILFQPHFHNMYYNLTTDEEKAAILYSEQYQEIQASSIFRMFKYIKTVTPIRRFTTSYGATVKFMDEQAAKKAEEGGDTAGLVSDVVSERIINRSFMIDWQDRLYKDSVLVRFEDGKLNPRATFTALAEFLDIPYTESMTYCSGPDGLNPESLPGNAVGFDPSTVYRTYDEYANHDERYFLEYFLRDAYQYCGYDFHYYDGAPMDEKKAKALIAGFTTLNSYIRKTWAALFEDLHFEANDMPEVGDTQFKKNLVDQQIKAYEENRLRIAKILMKNVSFINKAGQPLKMMPRLQLDPALLENPLYH